MSTHDDARGRCAESDLVIAHFLDGAPGPGSAALDLATHLRDCPGCQRELAMARRLDALVAATTPATTPATGEAELQNAFARLRAAAGSGGVAGSEELPAPLATPARASRLTRVLASLAVATAAALVVGHSARTSPAGAAESSGTSAIPESTSAATTHEQHGALATILLPDEAPPPRERPRAKSQPAEPAPIARFRRHGDDETFRSLVQALEAQRPGSADPAVLAAAARLPAFVGRLERELASREPATVLLRCAALLPTDRLDAILCEVGRADAGRCEVVALALRERGDVERSVPLWLDLWSECAARGSDPDPEARALRWFRQAPKAASRQLELELARTPSAERRQRCLFALGALGEPEAVPVLHALARGPRREEALLAAYALYHCGGLARAAADLRPAWAAALAARPRSFCEFSRHVDSPRRGEPVSESD